jgi:hypothetical protein
MPLLGTLSTMPLPDLLQWLGTARQTGSLQIERNKVVKWILFREGRVVGCSSDDPPERLGQFLLSRGKISDHQLRDALTQQQTCKQHLGMILVGMGAITEDDLKQHLTAKSEETVYSIFDWDDAVFRFEDGVTDLDHLIPVDIRVEELLLRGLRRYDEMREIRRVFGDPGIVLRQTPKMPPPEVFHNRLARRIYESITGDRTVAEILLLSHGSEYLVKKFLYELHRSGFAEIDGRRTTETIATSPAEPAQQPTARQTPEPDAAAHTSDAAAAPPAAEAPDPPNEIAERGEGLDLELATARHLMQRNEFEGALEILDDAYQAHPQDDSLRRLTAEAEAAFIEKAYRHYLPGDKVPELARPMEELETESLSPTEFYLLSRIDGVWDVRSIIQVTPLREVEALRTLKRMREQGIIELHDPAAEGRVS